MFAQNGIVSSENLANGRLTNGKSTNGKISNGTQTNGMPTNGLPTNGKQMNGTQTNGTRTYGALVNEAIGKLAAGKLAGRVAIVTASTEGIGLAVAKRLASDGAKVVICSRRQEKVTKALNELKSLYPEQVEGLVCHVGSEDDRNRLIDFTLNKFGKIDILVSNAAVNPYYGKFTETPGSVWDKIFDVNVKAPFMLTQKVVPHMMKNDRPGDRGAIVYISSIAAYAGIESIGAYSVSKTALLGLCRSMSLEVGEDGIRVNLVAPGVIKTKFSGVLRQTESQVDFFKSSTHMKRLGEVDEVSGVVSFLCGPDASYVTGENIVVAGGHHCGL